MTWLKNTLSALATVLVIGCGGGGDDPPVVPDYSKLNGTYSCESPAWGGVALPITGTFTASNAVLVLAGKYFDHNDVIGTYGDVLKYTEFLPNGIDAESVIARWDGTMVIYIGPRADLDKYYLGKEIKCKKI